MGRRGFGGGDFVDLDDETDTTARYRSARHGIKPVMQPCATLSAELDFTAETVKDWLAGGTVAETIAVLVRDRSQRDRVVAGLHERGVPVRSVDRESLRTGQPVVMTMHRAKGTEFAKVLLFEISKRSIPMGLRDYDFDESEKAAARLRERSLLYVAASRARDELVATWAGELSPLLGSTERSNGQ